MPYFEEEMAKGYQRPSFPLKLWVKLYQQMSTKKTSEYRIRFLDKIGFGNPRYQPRTTYRPIGRSGQQVPRQKIFNFDYCQDVDKITKHIHHLCKIGFFPLEKKKIWWKTNQMHIKNGNLK